MAVTYPLEGADATLYSIDPALTDLVGFLATGASASTGSCVPYSHEIAVDASALNITSQGASSRGMRAGLNSWTARIAARYPRVNRGIGATSTVTFASTARSFIRNWNLTVRAPAFDITSTTSASTSATTAAWRYFRPSKLIEWEGTFECLVDQGTIMTVPELSSTALASYGSLAFKLIEDGAADPTLSGTALITSLGHTMDQSNPGAQIARYAFSGTGDLSWTGGTNLAAIFGTAASGPTAIGIPVYDSTKNLIWRVDGTTARLWTGSAFWNEVSIQSPIDGLIEVGFGLQGTGPLTPT